MSKLILIKPPNGHISMDDNILLSKPSFTWIKYDNVETDMTYKEFELTKYKMQKQSPHFDMLIILKCDWSALTNKSIMSYKIKDFR